MDNLYKKKQYEEIIKMMKGELVKLQKQYDDPIRNKIKIQ